MGRKSINGGVNALGSDRIQFDFEFDGVRYRPTLKRSPTEANLKRARKQLLEIKQRIAAATFVFAEEFPEIGPRFSTKSGIPNLPRSRTHTSGRRKPTTTRLAWFAAPSSTGTGISRRSTTPPRASRVYE